MQTDAYRLWSTRIVTFAVSALAAASVGYWAVKGWASPKNATPPAVAVIASAPGGPQVIARALGGGNSVNVVVTGGQMPATPSRYTLLGIVASPGRGAALISVDGQDATPVRVGNPVEGGLVLKSVSARGAVLAISRNGPAEITLELPPIED